MRKSERGGYLLLMCLDTAGFFVLFCFEKLASDHNMEMIQAVELSLLSETKDQEHM